MKKIFLILLSVSLLYNISFSQKHPDFEIDKQLPVTSVKNQGWSGTCWSYATSSYLESEVLKKNGKELDIAEMFFVRYSYLNKAIYYLRLHGEANFSQGGQSHDVLNVIRQYGLVPQTAYPGITDKTKNNDHTELEKKLKSYLDTLLKKGEIPLDWQAGFNSILDEYLGKIPENFDFEGKKYNALTFAKQVAELNADDYIEITSFTHHPFYTTFDLEIPDNWSHDDYLNLPIDELITITDVAIANGYTVDWDGDVSEKQFNHRGGYARLTDDDKKLVEKYGFQKARQITFDKHTTTDDHLMHLTGIAHDKNGKKYYIIKNSWGESSNKYGGYLYMSEDYFKLKVIAITVNRNAFVK